MDLALFATGVAAAAIVVVALSLWWIRRLMRAEDDDWWDDDENDYRFPDDAVLRPGGRVVGSTRRGSADAEALAIREQIAAITDRYREIARTVAPDPALANDPEAVAVREQLAAIDAAHAPADPVPTGLWVPLEARTGERWVEK
jgi:hypothetical protein